MNIFELKETIIEAVDNAREQLQNEQCSNCITIAVQNSRDFHAVVFLRTITGYKLQTCKVLCDLMKREALSYSDACIRLMEFDKLL